MTKLTVYIGAFLLGATALAGGPLYSKHDYIKGNVPIMTNTEAYVSECIQDVKDYVDAHSIDPDTIMTTLREEAGEIARKGTNYADQVAAKTEQACFQQIEIESNKAIDNAVAAASNYTDSAISELRLNTAEIAMPSSAEQKGVTFVDQYGEDANVAIEIGRNAKAKVADEALYKAASNTVVRSVSIAIGAESDATVAGSPTKNQAIAIGWHAQAKASNAIAIGSGAEHPTEDTETGNATVASGSTAISIGYDAKATQDSTIAIGRSAKAVAAGSVQLGGGINESANTLQFKGYTLLDSSGQIPMSRLSDASGSIVATSSVLMERTYKNGNMTIRGDGSEGQEIEPMVNGLSEILIEKPTNGIWQAGGECSVYPPLGIGSRNYNIVIPEVPQAQGMTNGVPYDIAAENNFVLAVGDTLMGRKIMIDVSPSIGFKTGEYLIAVTNAPCIVKIREPSTNSFIMVVRPFKIEDI